MSKLTRLVAIGAIAAVPAAVAVPSANAQTPGQYAPYAPASPIAQTVVTNLTVGLRDKISDISFNKLIGSKSRTLTIAISGPGRYSIKVTSRVPGKRTTTLSQGSLNVPVGSKDTRGKISLKATKNVNGFKRTAKGKFKGKTIPVKIVATYLPPNGDPVSITTKSNVDK